MADYDEDGDDEVAGTFVCTAPPLLPVISGASFHFYFGSLEAFHFDLESLRNTAVARPSIYFDAHCMVNVLHFECKFVWFELVYVRVLILS